MRIVVTGKNIEVGESLRDFITQELHRVVEHYIGDIIEAQVIFSKDNSHFNTDITVHISKHFTVHCVSHGDDEAYRSATNAIWACRSQVVHSLTEGDCLVVLFCVIRRRHGEERGSAGVDVGARLTRAVEDDRRSRIYGTLRARGGSL